MFFCEFKKVLKWGQQSDSDAVFYGKMTEKTLVCVYIMYVCIYIYTYSLILYCRIQFWMVS